MTYTLTAQTLADARARCSSRTQLRAIDLVTRMLADTYGDNDPRFRAERFCTLARMGQGSTSHNDLTQEESQP